MPHRFPPRAAALALIAAFALAAAPETHAAGPASYYRTPETAKAGLPVSNAVRVGDVLYVLNQLGNGPAGGPIVSDSLAGQLDQTMTNIDIVLAGNGLKRDAIFRCMIALKDIADLPELNRLWPGYFKSDRLPVRNVIGVTGLPLNARVSVECQAAAGG